MDKVVIEIRNNVTGAYLRVPVSPATIQYSDGDALTTTVKILGLGNVNFRDGVDLDSFEYDAFFPARYDPSYCTTSALLEPLSYRNVFSGWKDAGTSLQLICPAAGLNKNMTLDSFTWELAGFEGDVYYHAAFKEVKNIKPKQIDISVAANGAVTIVKPTVTVADRPAAATVAKPATYTVAAGDTLSGIAKRYALASWSTLYDKNVAKIGGNPSVLQVGQVLTL